MDPTQTTPHRLPQRARDELSAAVAFLTRLPVRAAEPNLARACWAFPIVGAMVGATGGLVLIGGLLLNLPPLAAAIFATLAAMALSYLGYSRLVFRGASPPAAALSRRR